MRIGARVEAVSLLHSSGVDPVELGGVPARLLEPALNAFLAEQARGEAVLLPLFFGPSAALTAYVPERLSALSAKFPDARLRLAHWLVDPGSDDKRVAEALADMAKKTIARHALVKPKVVLVDHGSPQATVAAVRDFLGGQVKALLADAVDAFAVASMERRPGDAYAFNDPLLSALLRTPHFDAGDVVILLQFLSPGRHAGEGGDIAEISAGVRREKSTLRTWMTDPIGTHPRVLDVLADRYFQASGKIPELR